MKGGEGFGGEWVMEWWVVDRDRDKDIGNARPDTLGLEPGTGYRITLPTVGDREGAGEIGEMG